MANFSRIKSLIYDAMKAAFPTGNISISESHDGKIYVTVIDHSLNLLSYNKSIDLCVDACHKLLTNELRGVDIHFSPKGTDY